MSRARPITDAQREIACALYPDESLSLQTIGALSGMSAPWVHQIAMDARLPRRRPVAHSRADRKRDEAHHCFEMAWSLSEKGRRLLEEAAHLDGQGRDAREH